MAEYYTVLKRAVSGLVPNVPESRRSVYDKARNALIGQLKAVAPPLTTAEISRQRLELEEAIRKVERESALGAGATTQPVRAQPPAPPPVDRAPAPPPPPPPVAAPHVDEFEPGPTGQPSAQDVFRRAMHEAGIRGAEAAMRSNRAPAQPRADAPHYGSEPRPPRERVERAPPPTAPPPVESDYDEPQRAEPVPRLVPEYDHEWDRTPPPPPPGQAAGRRDRSKLPPPRRAYVEEDAGYERAARRSRLPGILLFLLVIAVVGGLGALGWSQRAMLTNLLATFDSGGDAGAKKKVQKDATPVAAPAAVEAEASSKNTDRLLEGQPPADTDVRVVEAPATPATPAETAETAEPVPEAVAVDPSTAPAGDTEALPETVVASAPAAEDADPGPAPAAAPAPAADAVVAQKAFLYEEPTDGSQSGVTQLNALVTWRFVQDGANGPEIAADLEVPDRGMKIHFTLHKNTDATLPASHLVEVRVETPAGFPGKGIRSIPRLVLKPSDADQGEPLVGAAAKVADGFFWIALSAAGKDVDANLAMIRERDWIDLPFVYETGQRAILTFEKGVPGDRVFDQALSAWSTPG